MKTGVSIDNFFLADSLKFYGFFSSDSLCLDWNLDK